MKHYKRFLCCLLLFLGILFSCAPTPQQITEEILTLASEKGRDSTVQIRSVRAKSRELTGVGSGFFVAPDKIATCLHNVGGKDLVFANLTDKETMWKIEGVTAFDFKNDLVVLKVVGEGEPFLLGDSDAVQIGEPVVTLGFPKTRYKITEGFIHGIGNNRFQVKAEYVGGMSGGPVLNSMGEVIGVAAMGTVAYGYAVPSNALKVLLSQSNLTESLAQFRKRDFVRVYTYYTKRQRRFLRGDYAGAIDTFNKVIELNPEFAEAYGARGLQKVHLGEFEAAKGNIKDEQDYYNEAIADFNEAFKLYGDSPDGHRLRGYTNVKLGESKAAQSNTDEARCHYHEAIEDFNKALKLNPKYASIYSNRGYAKTKLGESVTVQGGVGLALRYSWYYYAAIEDYTKAIRLMSLPYAETSLMSVYAKRLFQPEKADVYNKRGNAKFKLGGFEAAQDNVNQAEDYYRAGLRTIRKQSA